MQTRLWTVAALTLGVACGETGTNDNEAIKNASTLTLVREKKLSELLPSGRYEASGVALVGSSLRVVFDNRTEVATIDLDLGKAALGPGNESKSQYEGVTVATPTTRLFAVKEVGAADRGAIVTLDENGKRVATETTDIAFADGEKGLEGIAWLEDAQRLLVLCEAGSCGAKGKGSSGLIKSLRHESDAWVTDASIALPARANFDDYADLAVRKEPDGSYRVAVISQESSALWLGKLTMSPPAIARLDEGAVYTFPHDAGNIVYCSLEGVTFIDRETIAVVSDIPKDTARCTKAEAVHVFKLP